MTEPCLLVGNSRWSTLLDSGKAEEHVARWFNFCSKQALFASVLMPIPASTISSCEESADVKAGSKAGKVWSCEYDLTSISCHVQACRIRAPYLALLKLLLIVFWLPGPKDNHGRGWQVLWVAGSVERKCCSSISSRSQRVWATNVADMSCFALSLWEGFALWLCDSLKLLWTVRFCYST